MVGYDNLTVRFFCPFVVYEAAGGQEERDGHYYIKIFPYAISMSALV